MEVGTFNLTEIIGVTIPIFVCVVLPVMIVWLVMRAAINSDNKRAEVLVKAIENNANVDVDKLAEAFARPKKTPEEKQQKRLLVGTIFTLLGVAVLILRLFCSFDSDIADILMAVCFPVGIAFLVVYFVVNRKMKHSAENEEEAHDDSDRV